ncbi:MAG: o-succinylbenzoate synthase [Chloroflexi bacterium]|nr:o-succinylbenzoate synthase [Chloroflexota bacterium]
MRIERIEIYHVAMPLVYPFRTAYGDEYTIESVLVRMSGEGAYGWGEATPGRLPIYCNEWAAGVYALLRDHLAPRIVGQEVPSGEALQALLAAFKGNHFAKAALDLAWWDLDARQKGRPLWELLGGTGPTVDVGADFGVMDTVDELLKEIAKAKAAGFKRVKLKFRPGWDVDMVARVRAAFPDLPIHIDCNSAYRLESTAMFRKLDTYGLAMIEQPLAHDDLIDHATLQNEIDTPICLDESITSVDRARKAIEIGACGWINIKPGRVGGLTNAVAIHDLCQQGGIPCWVGGMLESAVGQGHNMALATLPNFRYPADVFPSDRFYAPDLAEPEIELSGPSRVTCPDAPGIGREPNSERLAKQTVQAATIDGC